MDEQKKQERHSEMKKGAYSLTPALYNALSKGDVIVFSEHGGSENHTAIILCGRGIDIIEEQAKRIKDLEAEIQEVSNQLMDLYDKCNETEKPEVYGAILGLHERLEQALKG